MAETIEIARIRTDGGTQSRAQLDLVTIAEYAEAMQAGDQFPTVKLFDDGEDLWLADGFHRVEAAKSIGRTTIVALVLRGSRRDAVLDSVGSNAMHGLRRTNADKRHAVELLLADPEWAQWSDREIARRCAVSHQTVSSIRAELTVKNGQSDAPALRKGADGRVIDTSNIGKSHPARASEGDPSPSRSQDDGEKPPTMLEMAERLRKLISGSVYDEAMGKLILDDLMEEKEGWYHDLVRCYVPETANKDGLATAAMIVWEEFYPGELPRFRQRPYPAEPQMYRPLAATTADAEPAAQAGEETWAAGAVGLARDWSAAELDEYVEANAPVVMTVAAPEGDPSPSGDQGNGAPQADDAAMVAPVSLRPDYDSDEWYTPVEIMNAARAVLGQIDLDPASCALANTVVHAARYYTRDEDGLRKAWHGRVWLNPPYSQPGQFVETLLAGYVAGRVSQAIVLVNNATETYWFQKLLRFPVCFPARRLQFWRHDHSGVGARQGQAIFYLGPDKAAFLEQFGAIGPVLEVIS